jgi:hypothetical protein
MRFFVTVALAALFYSSESLKFSNDVHKQSGDVSKPPAPATKPKYEPHKKPEVPKEVEN